MLRRDSSLDEAEPLLDVFESEVFAATSEPSPERLNAAWGAVLNWWSLLNTESEPDSVHAPVERAKLATPLLSVLKESPQVGRDANEFERIVVSASVQTLFDPESSPAEVAQAAMILDQLPTLHPESEAELSADLSDGSPADLVSEQRWSALLMQLSPVVFPTTGILAVCC